MSLSLHVHSYRPTALAAAAVKGQNWAVEIRAPVAEEAPAARQDHICVRPRSSIRHVTLFGMEIAVQNSLFWDRRTSHRAQADDIMHGS